MNFDFAGLPYFAIVALLHFSPTFAQKSYGQQSNEHYLDSLYQTEQFDRVVEVADSFIKTNPDNLARLYQIKADALYFLNDVQGSLDNYLLTIANLKQYPIDSVYLLESYSHTGFCYLYLGKYIEALPYYEQALKITEAGKDSLEMAIQLSHVGSIYSNLGQYQKASKFIQRAYTINFALNDSIALAYDLVVLGDLKVRSGDYKEAVNYYKDIFKLQQEKNINHNTSALRLGKIANAYLKMNEIDSATKYNSLAVKNAIKLGDSLTLVKQWIVTARIFNVSKKYDSALHYSNLCADYFHKYAGPRYNIMANFERIDAHLGKRQFSRASVLLDTVIHIAVSDGRLEDLSQAYKNQAALMEKLGSHQLALKSYKLYQEIEDSLQQRKKQEAILMLAQEYQTNQKEHEIALLTAKDEVSQLQLAKERNNFILLACILALVVISGGYVYYSIRKKHQLENELLTSQINELRTQIKVVLDSDASALELNSDGINKSLNTPLSDREFEILNFALSDLSNSEIADKAFVSVNTVKFHLKNVYEKLGVGNRKEALQFAIQSSKLND